MFSQDGEWSSKSFFFDEPLNLKYPHIRRAGSTDRLCFPSGFWRPYSLRSSIFGSSLNVERSVHVVLVH